MSEKDDFNSNYYNIETIESEMVNYGGSRPSSMADLQRKRSSSENKHEKD